MINQETKLTYANTDPSLHYNHSGPRRRVPGWRGAWIYCLKHRDQEAADLIYDRNKISEQCEDGECDDCHAAWCTCEHHSSVQFRLEHPRLVSLTEAQESEEAA